MAKYDRISAFFFVVLGFFISVESLRIGVGQLSNPGPGLLPLWCGLGFIIVGFIVFANTMGSLSRIGESAWAPGTKWGNIIATIVSITAFAFLVDFLGFFTVTLLWTAFMCKGVGKMGWKATIVTSVVTTVLNKILFQHYLDIQFPRGFTGF